MAPRSSQSSTLPLSDRGSGYFARRPIGRDIVRFVARQQPAGHRRVRLWQEENGLFRVESDRLCNCVEWRNGGICRLLVWRNDMT